MVAPPQPAARQPPSEEDRLAEAQRRAEAPVAGASNARQHRPGPQVKRLLPGIYMEPDLLASTAFHALNRTELFVLLRFLQKRQFGPKKGRQRREVVNNGRIRFPYSEAEEMGFSRAAFTRALDGLIGHGFVDITHSGEGLYRSATLYALGTRWRAYGTTRYEERARPQRQRQPRGFQRQREQPGKFLRTASPAVLAGRDGSAQQAPLVSVELRPSSAAGERCQAPLASVAENGNRGNRGACQHCSGPLPPTSGRGRPRQYCTDACRAAAHRRRAVEVDL